MLDSMSLTMANILTRQLQASRKQLLMLAKSPSLKSPEQYLQQRKEAMLLLQERMNSAQMRVVHLNKQRFIHATAKLDAMSPLKVLTRGYSMAESETGNVVRSVKQVNLQDKLRIVVSDGYMDTQVIDIKEDNL